MREWETLGAYTLYAKGSSAELGDTRGVRGAVWEWETSGAYTLYAKRSSTGMGDVRGVYYIRQEEQCGARRH